MNGQLVGGNRWGRNVANMEELLCIHTYSTCGCCVHIIHSHANTLNITTKPRADHSDLATSEKIAIITCIRRPRFIINNASVFIHNASVFHW